jgi:cephalosporin-C deacetylase-like acetyl esterase
LFAYYSVPRKKGPVPAILMIPGYSSVVHVPAHSRRRGFVVLAPCVRGQRLSDGLSASEFPGLLTDSVTDSARYPFRGMVADCLRAFDFLVEQDAVDESRIAIASGPNAGDLALLTAALRPEVTATQVIAPMLFRDAPGRIASTSSYPLEEFNDYLRANPDHREALERTIANFDPIDLIDRIKCSVRISSGEADRLAMSDLATALGERAETYGITGRGYIDHTADEEWLFAALTA